jgi:hypothetical protein
MYAVTACCSVSATCVVGGDAVATALVLDVEGELQLAASRHKRTKNTFCMCVRVSINVKIFGRVGRLRLLLATAACR